MFISRVEMPWLAVQNPYDIHRRLWSLFPGEAPESRQSVMEKRHGFLFRMEDYQTGCPARFLVQSRRRPALVASIRELGCREFDPQPQLGQRLAFLLTANPIKTILDTEKDAKPGKRPNQQGQFKCRVPLVQEQDQRNWLIRRLVEAADIEAVAVLPHSPLYFRKGRQGGKLVTATFEGVLHVKAPDVLLQLLENGLGPAKAFGCGLLLVRRV